ncbi:MAG: hypothetical protein ABI557_09125 [Aureliella sp.]
MHHSISQPTVAASAGDGTGGSYLRSSIADANLALSALSCTHALAGRDQLRSSLRLRSRYTRTSPIACAS